MLQHDLYRVLSLHNRRCLPQYTNILLTNLIHYYAWQLSVKCQHFFFFIVHGLLSLTPNKFSLGLINRCSSTSTRLEQHPSHVFRALSAVHVSEEDSHDSDNTFFFPTPDVPQQSSVLPLQPLFHPIQLLHPPAPQPHPGHLPLSTDPSARSSSLLVTSRGNAHPRYLSAKCCTHRLVIQGFVTAAPSRPFKLLRT